MEEDGGAKAPVTRLRRRRSVDQEESRSPTPSTPTKKRGRLAAKPQLDLIEENSTIQSPKRTTRKSVSRDIDAEEKLTPAQRSTRIRSNTSLVETKENEPEESLEDKLTPSRKVTRSQSNTSLIEIPSIDVNTPRAKRAARRNSGLGSDTETLTPTRTRRTRKGSTSSDIHATPFSGFSANKTPAKITRGRTAIPDTDDDVSSKEVPVVVIVPIPEEQDTEKSISPSNNDTSSEANSQTLSPSPLNSQSSPTNVRKSPRLFRKSRDRKSTGEQDKTIANDNQQEEQVNNLVKSSSSDTTNAVLDTDQTDGEVVQTETKTSDTKNDLSLSSANLLNNLDKTPKTTSGQNKSLSAIDDKDNQKRHRTKSCSTLAADSPSDDYFHSDNEKTKKKSRQKSLMNLKENANITMTGNRESNNIQVFEVTSETKYSKSKKKKSTGDTSIENTIQESIVDKADKKISEVQSTKDVNIRNESDKENLDKIASINASNAIKRLSEFNPIGATRSIEFIEDSDTGNEDKDGKLDDQCVPVVFPNQSRDDLFAIQSDNGKDDRSYEPMDIDETIPDHVSLTEYNSNRSRNSSLSVLQNAESKVQNQESRDKSKRKSSISNTSAKDSEQSNIENKSTLVLSQLNVSAGSEANASASSTEHTESVRKLSISKALDKSTNVSEPEADLVTSTQPNEEIPVKRLHTALLNCLTSTPVQDKDSKQSNLQENTSVITPIVEDKKKIDKSNKTTIAQISDDDSSRERNNMVDDEAMDAGDDYQSGDSQDEEERQYVIDHKIIEKGETLTSDDEDLSLESEYEKDSFLVSSDEEDNDLLSGSGEDLGMSDNELTMSKKSKKKYNDRKAKEQKKASKEMFEARHGRKPDKVSKPKGVQNNTSHVHLDSTLSDSGDDNKLPPKKNKRMRLESDSSFVKSELEKSETKNNSTLADMEEIGYKKKKSKRLSESLCNDSVLNENEVTVNVLDVEDQENDDPLTVAVKQEPKTPQKLDISTVHFTDRAEVEEVEVAENVTIMKSNETSDPLQASLDENDSDDESISENEEATKNYDSILNILSNHHKKQNKSRETSLNLNKNTKQTSKEPIIEHLNITTAKQKLKPASSENKDNKSATTKRVISVEESSSDSMDLKLLFSDDSNESHKGNDDKVAKTDKTPEKIIPLKRCDGKTDLLQQSLSTDDPAESNALNTSKNKKNKRISSQTNAEVVTIFSRDKDDDRNELPFFIDTVGSYGDATDGTTASLDISSKKKQQKHEKDEVSDDDGPPTEISSKKNKITDTDISLLYDAMASNTNASKKNKDKRHKKDKTPQEDCSPTKINSKKNNISDISLLYNEMASNTKASKKNKDKQHKKDEVSQEDATPTKINSKKNKITEISLLYDEVTDVPSNTKVSKKNKKLNASLNVRDSENDTSVNFNPKKNKSLPVGAETSDNLQLKSSKKDKNKKNDQSFEGADIVDSSHTTSAKKAKNKKGETCFAHEEIVDTSTNFVKKNMKDLAVIANDNALDKSLNTKSKKKNKKKTDLSLVNNDAVEESLNISKKTKIQSQESKDIRSIFDIVDEMEETKANRKRKRKSSLENEGLETPNVVIEVMSERKQKKSKIEDHEDKADSVGGEPSEQIGKRKRKRVRRDKNPDINQSPGTPPQGDQNKKRKERDEDDGGKLSKVMKTNSLNKVPVPRLPETILNQLDDKPGKEILSLKKAKVAPVATTDFSVDEVQRRKNKPSNFLEESIFLNDYESAVSKKPSPKLVRNKPKMLPFIPVASTSDKGFTTTFQVRVLSGKMEFKATAEKEADFKKTYLRDRKTKSNNLIVNKLKRVNLSKY